MKRVRNILLYSEILGTFLGLLKFAFAFFLGFFIVDNKNYQKCIDHCTYDAPVSFCMNSAHDATHYCESICFGSTFQGCSKNCKQLMYHVCNYKLSCSGYCSQELFPRYINYFEGADDESLWVLSQLLWIGLVLAETMCTVLDSVQAFIDYYKKHDNSMTDCVTTWSSSRLSSPTIWKHFFIILKLRYLVIALLTTHDYSYRLHISVAHIGSLMCEYLERRLLYSNSGDIPSSS